MIKKKGLIKHTEKSDGIFTATVSIFKQKPSTLCCCQPRRLHWCPLLVCCSHPNALLFLAFSQEMFYWLLLGCRKVTDFCLFFMDPVTVLTFLINCNHFLVSLLVFLGT